MAKRKFRIVKRQNNIPVLGVCEYCNAEFTADPATICRPKDGHAFIQKQFIAHKCKRMNASPNAVRIVRVQSTSRIWDTAPKLSQSAITLNENLPGTRVSGLGSGHHDAPGQ